MAIRRGYPARKIQRAYRAYRGRRALALYRKKRGAISRLAPRMAEPTFTETFALPRDNMTVFAGSSAGKAFKVSFHDVPQWPQYMNLYSQYKINWVKVMLLPTFNTDVAEVNAANVTAGKNVGMARIAYAIQDTPGVTDPLTEAEVLQDNGAKIRSIGTKWSCSFKPVPDIKVTTDVGTIYTRQKARQWFNFDPVTTGNNPEHGAVAAYITLPGSTVTPSAVSYECYYKVNFSLRDPK